MASAVDKLLNTLRDVASVQNADILRDYPAKDALTIWTEGGEWPMYDSVYDKYVAPDVIRNVEDINYTFVEQIHHATSSIMSNVDECNMAGLSMDCGQGKSTKIVRVIHNLKLGRRTLVVQPSSLVAIQLVNYINKPDVRFVNDYTQILDTRGIYYMSAGQCLDLLIRGIILNDDTIVIDEAHCSSLVHIVLYNMLSRIDNILIMMTASTSPDIKAKKGVKLKPVDPFTFDVQDVMNTDQDAVVVGVNNDSTYATSANLLTGLTIPSLKTVYDTGLRPEPRTLDGAIHHGERKATIPELIQSMGRLGRVGLEGIGYYVVDAVPLRRQPGVPLYSIVASTITQTLGLSKCNNRAVAVTVWQHSGILNYECKTEKHDSDACSASRTSSQRVRLTAQSLQSLNDSNSVRCQSAVDETKSVLGKYLDTHSKYTPSVTTARINYHKVQLEPAISRPSTASPPNYSSTVLNDKHGSKVDVTPDTIHSPVVSHPVTVNVTTHATDNHSVKSSQGNRNPSLKEKQCKTTKGEDHVNTFGLNNTHNNVTNTPSIVERRHSSSSKSHCSYRSNYSRTKPKLKKDEVINTEHHTVDDSSKVNVYSRALSSKTKLPSGLSTAQRRVESRMCVRQPPSKTIIDLDIERHINMSKSTKSGQLIMTTGIMLPNTRDCIITGDIAWSRLYRKGADPVIPEGKLDSTIVRSYWETIVDAMQQQDSIFPSILPIVDSRQTSMKSVEDARKVLSFEKEATYSEQEILSVIILWNKYVLSLRTRSANYERLYKYVTYFDDVYGFGKVVAL